MGNRSPTPVTTLLPSGEKATESTLPSGCWSSMGGAVPVTSVIASVDGPMAVIATNAAIPASSRSMACVFAVNPQATVPAGQSANSDCSIWPPRWNDLVSIRWREPLSRTPRTTYRHVRTFVRTVASVSKG